LTEGWRASVGLSRQWEEAPLEALASAIQYGYTASADAMAKGPRFLRITDIQNGKVDWSTVPGCEVSKTDAAKFGLKPGDIVFARSGATTGKSYLVGDCPEAVFASYLIRVRAGPRVGPAFLAIYFQSPAYWSHIADNLAGNAQPNCNASKLAELSVPVPSLPEQAEIVRRVQLYFSLADSVERRVIAATGRAEKLPHAILSRAFAGELVPTEAELARAEGRSYETAEELLERIRREREAEKETGQGRKKSRRTGGRARVS